MAKSGANANEEVELTADESLSGNGIPKEGEKINEKYTVAFYTKQLPTNRDTIANLIKDRNFAYYQLGIIYKEKFKEYARATNKLETLLSIKPAGRSDWSFRRCTICLKCTKLLIKVRRLK